VRDVQIRLKNTGENSDVLRPKFDKLLKSIDPAAQISKLEVVGPQVGDELRNSAIVSLAAWAMRSTSMNRSAAAASWPWRAAARRYSEYCGVPMR